jgi:hypothetical protein
MMFADMIIEFVYLIMRILYNIVKYISIGTIKLVKWVYRRIKVHRTKKKLRNYKVLDIIKMDGKYVLKLKGGPKI